MSEEGGDGGGEMEQPQVTVVDNINKLYTIQLTINEINTLMTAARYSITMGVNRDACMSVIMDVTDQVSAQQVPTES